MYAVVTTGGKQYRVEAGSELVIERLAEDAGASVTFDRVLLVGDGEAVTIGTPTVDGASVSGTVLGEELGPKLIIFKFKQKATYRRTRGHRQHLVRVRIDEINASGKKVKPEEPDEVEADAPQKAATAAKAAGASASAKAGETKKPARARPARARKATTTKAETAGTDAPAKPAPRRRSPAKKAESKE